MPHVRVAGKVHLVCLLKHVLRFKVPNVTGFILSMLTCVPDLSPAVQETLQSRIHGALDQLSHATQVLNDTSGLDQTTQIEDLLEDIVRQQKEIATQHDVWAAEQLGDTSRTIKLGISEGVTKTASTRCASGQLLCLNELHFVHSLFARS
jgi:hypothetical protein